MRQRAHQEEARSVVETRKRVAAAALERRHHRGRRPRRGPRDIRRIAVILSMSLLLLCVMTIPVVAADATGSLPSVNGISTARLHQDLIITDRHGAVLADIGNQGDHRIVVPLSAISPFLIHATVAIEDRTFFTNSGIDVSSIVRAALADISRRQVVQGASTITQQLAKQLYFGPNPPATLQRKLREGLIALMIARQYSKADILEMYLNTIYYGSQAYGVEAAAQTYFHASAASLSLAQAALIAGLPKAPTAYDPVLHPEAAKQRQLEVLGAMAREGLISPKQGSEAASEGLSVYPPTTTIQAPHFVSSVLDVLRRKFHITPEDGRGYRVTTSLDFGLQSQAEAAVQAQIAREGAYYNFHDAALVSIDPKTGEILAMVGGADTRQAGGQINMATSATRQTGSAFKIFTYTAAIESRKLSMVSPILDAPIVFPVGGGNGFETYAPANYDGRFHGTLPLKVALGNSLNIPAIKVELWTGIPAVLDVARRMGATTLTKADDTYGPSLTLGAYPVPVLDMAVAASTLATLGIRRDPAPILSIQDSAQRVIYRHDPAWDAFPAVSPQVAFIMASILSDDRNRCMEFGCHGDLTLNGRHVAAKTGTSQEFRDNWTLGYTPSLTTVVWVGNPDYKPLSHNSTGIVGAAPIWHQFMTQALKGKPDEWYSTPPGVTRIGDNYFLPGTERVQTALARAWPHCRFGRYNPYALTWSQILVNGLPCSIR
jgi:membrane peptidoglycan carboxypeptidase